MLPKVPTNNWKAMAAAWVAGTFLAGGLACQMSVTTNPPPNSGGTVSFADQVQPVFTNNCAGCHAPGGEAAINGIAVDLREGHSYNSIVNQKSVQNGDWTIVVPGDAESSLLYLKIDEDDPPVGVRMPRFAQPLPESDISLIEDWINQGALNN